MQFQKYMNIGQYILLCHIIFHHVIIVYAIIGPEVEPVDDEEFPFIVGLVKNDLNDQGERELICTGSLISKRDVLTADHCFPEEYYDFLGVVIGSTDIATPPKNGFKWWKSNDKWLGENRLANEYHLNDISIGRLLQDVGKDIKIAKLKYKSWRELEGKQAMAAGWGKITMDVYPRILRKAKLKILSKTECERRLTRLSGGTVYAFGNNQMCSIGEPYAIIIGGDSGSPLVYHNSIVAINAGTTPITVDGTFNPDKLNMHMNIYFYKAFIKSVLKCSIIIYQVSIIYALIGPEVKEADPDEFPFIVGIVEKHLNIHGQRRLLCTGSLISRRDVLTAEHCFSGEICASVGVIVGSNDITSTPNNDFKWWKSYEEWISDKGQTIAYHENDIAIGRLSQDLSKNTTIVKLKYMSWNELQKKHVTAVGWGKISLQVFPKTIHKANVKILSKLECEIRLSDLAGGTAYEFHTNTLCSIGKPYVIAVSGDSGGPLLYHNKIVAINTGTTPPSPDGSFNPDQLNMHINVNNYKEYIKAIVKCN